MTAWSMSRARAEAKSAPPKAYTRAAKKLPPPLFPQVVAKVVYGRLERPHHWCLGRGVVDECLKPSVELIEA
jgi:hypothetical protein